MTSSLQITKELSSSNTWEITATVIPGGSLPLDIFLYLNTGTTELGEYQGVADIDEYQRFTTFVGTSIPKFGNKFVKYGQAKIKLDINNTETPEGVIKIITDSVKALSSAFQNAPSTTTIISIP